jgi:hypothetical protein
VDVLCERFSAFDVNEDGAPEIASLNPLGSAGETGARVLLLVEARLLAPLDGAPELSTRVERWVTDLASEGYRADAIAVDLGSSELHQDGRTVLALREFLRAVAGEDELAGVVLLGRFPDAFVVRTCNWRKRETISLHKGDPEQATYEKVPYVRRVPEDIAHRADIVLSDLDGRWEDVYVQPKTRLDTTVAVYPDGIPPTGGPCADLEHGAVVYEDFFHVSDGKLEVSERLDPAGMSVSLFDSTGDHECGALDRARPNAMAVPDILVSRIDAKGTALRPRTSVQGCDGEGLLDADGRPQAVDFGPDEHVPQWSSVWEFDPLLERRLLAEYLDRNHGFRSGESSIAWRPASIACGLGSGFGVLSRAAQDWRDSDPGVADVHGNPTLAEFANWMDYPAILRTVRAHSDHWGSVFAKGSLDDLESDLGGPVWSWSRRGTRLEPSLASACGGGKLDWFLLRTLWENDALADEPAFYHHTGCHGISPPGAKNRPYDHPSYGVRQGAEALLFYGRGLALVGRAKVFYDEPRGFAEALAVGDTFGAAWRRYFELESAAESWGQVGGDIGRKRAYFWSVLGDWTLRLSMAAPSD